jgi:hypothetical protein
MNFYINQIRVNSIASIGSLNIGNTILSGNCSTILNQSGDGAGEDVKSEGSSITPHEEQTDDIFEGNPPSWRCGG